MEMEIRMKINMKMKLGGATNNICQEIRCLPYAGFFFIIIIECQNVDKGGGSKNVDKQFYMF